MADNNYSILRTIAEILTGVLQAASGGALLLFLGAGYVAFLPFTLIFDIICMCLAVTSGVLPLPPLATSVLMMPCGLVLLVGSLYKTIDAGFPNTRSVFSFKNNKDQDERKFSQEENASLLVNENNTPVGSKGLSSSQDSVETHESLRDPRMKGAALDNLPNVVKSKIKK